MLHLTTSLVFVGSLSFALAGTPARPAANTTFESQVRPILKAYCFDCHGEGEKLNGNLDLRLARLIAKGGDSGPALEPGKPDDSLILHRVIAGEMPPSKNKLPPPQIAILRQWISEGARVQRAEPDSISAGLHISDADRAYWAFQPIRRPDLPNVRDSSPGSAGIRNAIDAFLLVKLRERNLGFAPPADKQTLIRRASFDLLGLPPTPEDVDSFVADHSPNASERLIERLLASPHYGERWGRHWLDVAGYADSEGYTQQDPVRPNAYKYRDYVIRSFNNDKPFDQFIAEQLAGDELVRPPYANLKPDELDKLIATGFLRMAADGTASGGVNQKLARNQVLTDTIKIVSSTLLGLTMQCAQCHNHRYDPISQVDYYRMRAIFEPALDVKNWRPPTARQVSLYTDADRKKAADLEAQAKGLIQQWEKRRQEVTKQIFEQQLAKLPEKLRPPIRAAWTTPANKRSATDKKLLQDNPMVNVSPGSVYLYDQKAADGIQRIFEQAAALRGKKPVEEFVRALTEFPGPAPTTFLFSRGDPDQPKQPVAPGGLSILDEWLPLKPSFAGASGLKTFAGASGLNNSATDKALPTTGRRLAFARWLTDGRNPLTARVIVNRVWMHHFGRGLVSTPAEFGKLGERPTHPELLDWLANEFVSSGWRMKRLHYLIMTSTAYRQMSRRDLAKEAVDPDNRLLGRISIRRLEAEAIRDGMLAVSGRLVRKPFGPPIPVKENEVGQYVLGIENRENAGRFGKEVQLPAGDEFRRSIYAQVRRTRPLMFLDTFDWARPEPNCELRKASTVAPQALVFMNNEFVIAQAEALAARVAKEAGPDPKAQVIRAWKLAFTADPANSQLRDALAYLADQTRYFKDIQTSTPVQSKPKTKSVPLQVPSSELRALTMYCQALLGANRFVYVD